MATTLHIDGFAERLKALEVDYFETHYHECPPIVTKTMERMNALSAGTRNPTLEELVAISEAYDVSINYLVTGDEMFPSLRTLKKRDARKILDEIENLKPEIEI